MINSLRRWSRAVRIFTKIIKMMNENINIICSLGEKVWSIPTIASSCLMLGLSSSGKCRTLLGPSFWTIFGTFVNIEGANCRPAPYTLGYKLHVWLVEICGCKNPLSYFIPIGIYVYGSPKIGESLRNWSFVYDIYTVKQNVAEYNSISFPQILSELQTELTSFGATLLRQTLFHKFGTMK